MTTIDPYLVVRGGAVYVAAVAALGVCVWRRPDARTVAGGALASLWAIPVLIAANAAAVEAGWWHFDATGGTLVGVPVDLILAWAVLWGFVPVVALPRAPLTAVVVLALAVDLVAMPAAEPVVQLGPWWLLGEGVMLAGVLVPAQWLARATRDRRHLVGRSALQMIAFAGYLLFLIPAVAIEHGDGWTRPGARPAWQIGVFAQWLVLTAALGISAVQEFVTRGGGTPVPLDPPRRLVQTGLYAYVRNPMQLSGIALLLLLGALVGNWWLAAAAVVGHVFATGLAGRSETGDLVDRFGPRWLEYRSHVPAWIPRWRPWHPPMAAPARLYVGGRCERCQEVGAWFARHDARALVILPAECHPTERLTRIRDESASDAYAASGVEAVARALEHVHVGWALAGALIRLPLVRPLVQLIVDASGGGPRRVDAEVAYPPTLTTTRRLAARPSRVSFDDAGRPSP